MRGESAPAIGFIAPDEIMTIPSGDVGAGETVGFFPMQQQTLNVPKPGAVYENKVGGNHN